MRSSVVLAPDNKVTKLKKSKSILDSIVPPKSVKEKARTRTNQKPSSGAEAQNSFSSKKTPLSPRSKRKSELGSKNFENQQNKTKLKSPETLSELYLLGREAQLQTRIIESSKKLVSQRHRSS